MRGIGERASVRQSFRNHLGIIWTFTFVSTDNCALAGDDSPVRNFAFLEAGVGPVSMIGTRNLQWVIVILMCTCVSMALADGTATSRSAQPRKPAAPVTWLTDDQGREYRIDKLPKSQAHHKEADGKLRTVWGFTVDLAGEDDTNYWVKVYRIQPTAKPAAAASADKAAAAAIAASYRVTTREGHLLSFEPFDRGLPQSGQWRNGFVLADMNGDGHLDIVHGPARKRPGPPVIFLGDGKGDWRRWTEATFPAARYDYGDVAVADFNGDGRPDIAMGMHLLGVTALLQDGTGKFRLGDRGMDNGSPATGFSSRAILAVDWTGSGRADVVALADGPRMSPGAMGSAPPVGGSQGLRLYANAGNGVWTKPAIPSSSTFGDALASVRLSDGRHALVSGSNRLGSTDLLFVADGHGSWNFESLPGVRPMALVGAVAVADFDGDGTDDIAIGYRSFEGKQWRSGIDLLLQQKAGGWKRHAVLVTNTQAGVSALAAGDLTGDGLPDLAAGIDGGRVAVLVNNGKAMFTRERTTLPAAAQGPSCHVYRVAIEDLTGDGRGELVAGFAGEEEGMLALKSAGCAGEGSLRAWRSSSVPVRPKI
jgi:hypothetical protein